MKKQLPKSKYRSFLHLETNHTDLAYIQWLMQTLDPTWMQKL